MKSPSPLRQRLRYLFQYIPFTANTLFLGVAAYLAYRILYKPLPGTTTENTDALRPFIMLMGKFALWFGLALVGASLLSTIIVWLHFLWLSKRRDASLQISFETQSKPQRKSRLFLQAVLDGVRRPILGFVKARLFYDNYEMTDRFTLLSNKRKPAALLREGITGRSRLDLPDIKEYHLRGGFVYFEDMLHLLSLAVKQPVNGHFHQPPVLDKSTEDEVFPKKTENMDVRIEQMRRVEGEYLNYKDFETGDDVRRIVWKVYARNRELVVRVPEIFEPYASHLYFYASFQADLKAQWQDGDFSKEMLNYYKNRVWTVYDSLSKKDFELRYIPDQSLNLPEQAEERERVMRLIGNSDWQNDQSVNEYFDPRRGAVLCISSLTNLEELRHVLERCDAGTLIYFVKVSQAFKHVVAWNWLKRLVFLPPKDRLNRVRGRWTFSPLRLHLQKKEKEIEALLEKSPANVGIL